MTTKHFTHLHLHTEYSLLDGAIRISDLVTFAKEQQWKSIGISDHGNIFGAVKFFKTAKDAGIKPILGCEMYLAPDVTKKDAKEKYYHLVLIVQNKIGYQNLCRLMAFSYQEGFYFKPRIDYETLAKHSEGLIVSTACLGGHIPSLLRHDEYDLAKDRTEWFLNVFGPDRFFFELMPPEFEKQRITNERLTKLAHEMQVKLITTGDAHYLRAEDHHAHEVLLSVQTHDVMTNPNRYSFGEARCHLRTTQDMLEAFPDQHHAVWQTGLIADSCEFSFEEGKLFFPNFPVPEQHTSESYFKELCVNGLKDLVMRGCVAEQDFASYQDRMEWELELIIKMGFTTYFLVVSDFIQWAKRQGIAVGPGRGSVAGALVAWALGITNIDPIKYNLLFERFLNPERVSMPDIDIDFCIDRREEVINYVKDKYGHDCVCQIITFGTMMAKGVIKDVARTLGFPFKDANAITDLIPDQLKITIHEALEQEPALKQMMQSNHEVKNLIELCLKLEGLTRHASKHAAGVVISPQPLRDMLPLYIPAKTTDLVAQYAMTELESVGFLKMDFLGLKNLTLIEQVLAAIRENHNVNINLDTLSLDDLNTFKLLCAGNTDGVFQFESDGIKDVLRKLQPNRFEDLIAVNALYRPGPLGSGMVDDFIDRRHGHKKTTYAFPELEPILSETYGVIVYQEQVMKIASVIGGYTLGGADILRRAMGKKKADVMAEQKELFCQGAIKSGFDRKKSEELFDLMAYFAGYGFNKSHSAAYALIAYHTAYLKANYPLEFMAALVSFETNNPEKLTQYLQEIHDMGITTMPPDINQSAIAFRATNNAVRFGLQGIKNVGLAALEVIIAERAKKPFLDLLDFCMRVDLRTVNKRVIESLIGTGAMDCMPGNRAQKTHALENIIARAIELKEAQKTGQTSLFSIGANTAQTTQETYKFEPLEEWSSTEKLAKEKELAGFYLSSHPLKTYEEQLTTIAHETIAQTHSRLERLSSATEPTVACVGLLQTHKIILTKKGDKMAFAQLEDLTGHAEIIIFPKLFKTVQAWLDQYTVFLVVGTLDIASTAKCKIKANQFIPIELVPDECSNAVSRLVLTMPASIEEETLQTLHASCRKGSAALELRLIEHGTELIVKPRVQVRCTTQLLSEAKKFGIRTQMIFTE